MPSIIVPLCEKLFSWAFHDIKFEKKKQAHSGKDKSASILTVKQANLKQKIKTKNSSGTTRFLKIEPVKIKKQV
jgi:DNA-binding transcriptional regulator YdaS (Cro superfamily)